MENNRIAIVAVAYNRELPLKRLLSSLEKAFYRDEKPTLIISIDKSNTDAVERFADNYSWPHGEKIVRKHEKNLGLRNHMMSLGEWFDQYDTIVVLEDDIVVSPSFYSYVREASDKYFGNDHIAGISLYGFATNYQTGLPFSPVKNEYDGYFMNCAMSWGEVWMKPQWQEFYDWYLNNLDFGPSDNIPSRLFLWKKSWLKYHTRYCIETNKYFLHPYVSLSTNCGDVGVHNVGSSNYLSQVPLQIGDKHNYRLPDTEKEAILYDGFFENKNIYKILGYSETELCVDINGEKANKGNLRYWLTTKRHNYKIVDSFAFSYRPIEMGVLNRQHGTDVFLYDTTISQNNPVAQKQDQKELLFRYNLPSITSLIGRYGKRTVVLDYCNLILKVIKIKR